jgi:hypothetical protein
VASLAFGKYQDQVHKKSKNTTLDSKKGYYSKRSAWLCTGNRADENTQTPQQQSSETFTQSKIPSFQQLETSSEEARRAGGLPSSFDNSPSAISHQWTLPDQNPTSNTKNKSAYNTYQQHHRHLHQHRPPHQPAKQSVEMQQLSVFRQVRVKL